MNVSVEEQVSLLKEPPSGTVQSLDEFFAIAHALEREASTRYVAFAARARLEGLAKLALLFERLAEEERHHEAFVLDWAQKEKGRQPSAAHLRWTLPPIFEEATAGELAVSRTTTAYRILSMAVRNEERAFSFWSYVAAEAPSPEVRAAAERMALEELRHVSLLRRARRQAYHAQRRRHPPDAAQTLSDRLAEALELERRLALQVRDLAMRLPAEDRIRADAMAAESMAMARELEPLARAPRLPIDALDATAAAERLADDYIEIAEATKDESTALLAQSLAGRAVSRLALLRQFARKVG